MSNLLDLIYTITTKDIQIIAKQIIENTEKLIGATGFESAT